MFPLKFVLFALVGLCGFVSSAHAAWWFIQQPESHVTDGVLTPEDTLDDFRNSDINPRNLDQGFESADNFTGIHMDANYRMHIRWWGSLSNEITPTLGEFTINLYQDVGTVYNPQPHQTPFMSYQLAETSDRDTGYVARSIGQTVVEDNDYYVFNARITDPSLLLDENSRYWISIVESANDNDSDSRGFLWANADTDQLLNESIRKAEDSVFGNQGSWAISAGGGRAFQIDIQPVPEPGGVALLSVVGSSWYWRRRKRSRSR